MLAGWIRHWNLTGIPLKIIHYKGQKLHIISSAFLFCFSDATTFARVLNIRPLEFVTERMLMNGSNKIKHLEKEFPKYLPPPSPSKLQVMAFSHSTDKSSLSTTEAFPAHGKEKLMFLVLLLPQTCNWSGNESLKV